VYTLSTYVGDVVKQGRYLAASHDAVKAMGFTTETAEEKYVVNPEDCMGETDVGVPDTPQDVTPDGTQHVAEAEHTEVVTV
jgi:hypothetical protein